LMDRFAARGPAGPWVDLTRHLGVCHRARGACSCTGIWITISSSSAS